MLSKSEPAVISSPTSLSPQTLLFEGCRELNYEKALQAIKEGADVNVMAAFIEGDSYTYTSENLCFSPLSLLAMHGNTQLLNAYEADMKSVEIAKLLLEHGANITILDTSDMGNSPMHWAIGTFKKKLCKLFIQHAVSTRSNAINLPNQPSNHGWASNPPLILALKVCSQYLVHDTYFYGLAKLLVNAGADVNAVDNHQQSALHWAAILRMPEDFFNLLMEKNASYFPDEFGKTPKELYETVLKANMLAHNYMTSFRTLDYFIVDWRCNTNPLDDRERALRNRNKNYQTAVADMLGVFDLSLTENQSAYINIATLNEKDDLDRTKLHRAVFSANLEEVKKLLKMGADLTIKDVSGFTPLQLAQHLQDKFTLAVAPGLFGGEKKFIRAAQCDAWKKIVNVISAAIKLEAISAQHLSSNSFFNSVPSEIVKLITDFTKNGLDQANGKNNSFQNN